jgi:hypothetical protein
MTVNLTAPDSHPRCYRKYKNGAPVYATLKNVPIAKKLAAFALK